jgi:hypothetical protein
MTRIFVLTLSLLFIVGFAMLTIIGIAQHGLTFEAVLSVFVLVLLGVGVVGALRNPPRR